MKFKITFMRKKNGIPRDNTQGKSSNKLRKRKKKLNSQIENQFTCHDTKYDEIMNHLC